MTIADNIAYEQELLAKIATGYGKIAQSGGIYVTASFYNPITKDSFTVCVRDFDYDDCRRDLDALYFMPINENVVRQWERDNDIIHVGDTVEVYKGRKVARGTIAKVVRIYDWCDRYGRAQTRYVVFEDGQKTNINNCRII